MNPPDEENEEKEGEEEGYVYIAREEQVFTPDDMFEEDEDR